MFDFEHHAAHATVVGEHVDRAHFAETEGRGRLLLVFGIADQTSGQSHLDIR